MALMNCKDCGKQISIQAQACPNCGRPISSLTRLAEASKEYNKADKGFAEAAGVSFSFVLIVAIFIVGMVAILAIKFWPK